jgi:predicted membrane protein
MPLLVAISLSSILFWYIVRNSGYAVDKERSPHLSLIMISLCAWGLIVLGFLAPPILHHWPFAAFFGLAIAGGAYVEARYPTLFRAILLVMATYTVVVWLFDPIRNALRIDPVAAAVFVLVLGWPIIQEKF